VRKGAYEIHTASGETAEVDQIFAREVVMNGQAELLEGGFCEVVVEKDGYHRYTDWQRTADDHVPLFERCEILRVVCWDRLVFPAGFPMPPGHKAVRPRVVLLSGRTGRVFPHDPALMASPKNLKVSASAQAGTVKTRARWSKHSLL
jgi:hypothetical protein